MLGVTDRKNLTDFAPVTLRDHEMLLVLAQHVSPVQFYLLVLVQMVQRNLRSELNADPVLSQVHQWVAELFLVQEFTDALDHVTVTDPDDVKHSVAIVTISVSCRVEFT